jgi:hypothetical protein
MINVKAGGFGKERDISEERERLISANIILHCMSYTTLHDKLLNQNGSI